MSKENLCCYGLSWSTGVVYNVCGGIYLAYYIIEGNKKKKLQSLEI